MDCVGWIWLTAADWGLTLQGLFYKAFQEQSRVLTSLSVTPLPASLPKLNVTLALQVQLPLVWAKLLRLCSCWQLSSSSKSCSHLAISCTGEKNQVKQGKLQSQPCYYCTAILPFTPTWLEDFEKADLPSLPSLPCCLLVHPHPQLVWFPPPPTQPVNGPRPSTASFACLSVCVQVGPRMDNHLHLPLVYISMPLVLEWSREKGLLVCKRKGTAQNRATTEKPLPLVDAHSTT